MKVLAMNFLAFFALNTETGVMQTFISLTYLRGLEVEDLKEEDMPMI